MAPFDDSWTRADTVVVGGGTSGPAVAGLLAESSSERVLVLEAGPDYGARDSGRWPADLLDARAMPISHDWGYDSGALYPERVLAFDRARVIGGCSSHNGCVGALGQPRRLRRLGRAPAGRRRAGAAVPSRFAPDGVRPGEDAELGALPPRSAGGRRGRYGLPRVARSQRPRRRRRRRALSANIRMAIRWNAAFAYLDPVRERAEPRRRSATRSSTASSCAAAARCACTPCTTGRALVLEAGRVVLTAGTYGSPAILLRSGIGPARDLERLGIDVVLDLPGVGGNLHDHPMAELDFTGSPAAVARARRRFERAASCPRSRRSRSSARRTAARPSICTSPRSRPCSPTACSPDGCCSRSPA